MQHRHSSAIGEGNAAGDGGEPASGGLLSDLEDPVRDQAAEVKVPPAPVLSAPQMLPQGALEFFLNAYTNRNYVIEFATQTTNWADLKTISQSAELNRVTDLDAANSPFRLYRARLAP